MLSKYPDWPQADPLGFQVEMIKSQLCLEDMVRSSIATSDVPAGRHVVLIDRPLVDGYAFAPLQLYCGGRSNLQWDVQPPTCSTDTTS
jgi:hypothetical protein